jgi:RNA polymerase sigma factor (sigma-70 family)
MKFGEIEVIVKKPKKKNKNNKHLKYGFPIDSFADSGAVGESVFVESIRTEIENMFIGEEAAGVGIVTKQNATADVPVGGEYMNVSKLFPKKKKKKTKEDIDTTLDLNKALDTLEPRLKDVVLMRFKYNMTFKEIAKELNVGNERARQILLRALRKLRHHSRGITEPPELDESITRITFKDGKQKFLRTYGKMTNDQIIAYFEKMGKEVDCIDNDCDIEENFADGKVKGKSRPGRVKRAGASCNGSVTDLRKRAKNSSGEKAKMYHWCANMKSGKKK